MQDKEKGWIRIRNLDFNWIGSYKIEYISENSKLVSIDLFPNRLPSSLLILNSASFSVYSL